jgi:hypothetical protein
MLNKMQHPKVKILKTLLNNPEIGILSALGVGYTSVVR